MRITQLRRLSFAIPSRLKQSLDRQQPVCGFGFLNPAGVIRIAGDATFTVTVLGSPTGGTFTLLVNGAPTAAIAYNASAATVKAAIVAVDPGISASNVTVTGSGPYSVTLPATLAHGTDALTGGTSPTTTVA